VAKASIGFIATLLLLSFVTKAVYADWSIDIESGLAFSGYNDVRIPGNTGTNISLSRDLDAENTEFVRVRLAVDLGDRHRLSFLYAPLQFESSGTVDREVHFNGARFAAGVPLNSLYRFDSYRVTYHYTLINKERITAGIGFTGKVRDAAILIESADTSSEKTNTGFVPLINFALDWSFTSKLGLLIEGDALAAPQGRAEDVLVAVYGHPSNKLRLRLGYRVLEGGADNDEVYTFALIHYLSAGVSWTI